MSSSELIKNVNEADFEYEVIAYSQNKPVVVDFWASWCKPCKVLSPILEKLTVEAQGNFRLAKVDVDENPNLAIRFGVRTIPSVKAFSGGQIVAEFVGAQPEPRLREFVNKITPPSPLNLAIEKAESVLLQHLWQKAETLFRQILAEHPDNPACLLGLAKALLGQGKNLEDVETMLYQFPASRYYTQAEALRPLAEALVMLQGTIPPAVQELDIAFSNCLRLVRRGNIPAALDGLLDILRKEKHHNSGKTHQVVLAILELYGTDDPLSRQYRSELASVLF